MLKGEAKVLAVLESGGLLLESDRRTPCGSCMAGCGRASRDAVLIPSPTGLDLRAGDRIDLSADGSAILKLSLLFYLLPLAGLLAAVLLAEALGAAEPAAIAAGLAGLVLAFQAIRLHARRTDNHLALRVSRRESTNT